MSMSVGLFGSDCHFRLSFQEVRSCHSTDFFAGEGHLLLYGLSVVVCRCLVAVLVSALVIALMFAWLPVLCHIVAFAFVDGVAHGRPTHQRVASVRGCLTAAHTPASRVRARMTDSGFPPSTAFLAHFSRWMSLSGASAFMCIRSAWQYCLLRVHLWLVSVLLRSSVF